MERRSVAWLVLVCACVGLLAGCERSKPVDGPQQPVGAVVVPETASQTESPITFALASPVGVHQEIQALPSFEWVVANCDAQEAKMVVAMQAVTLPVECELVLDAAPEQARLYQDQMHATLMRLYGMALDAPRCFQQPVSVTVAANTIVTQPLSWEKVYDTNEMVMHRDGQVIARVPVRVLWSARLIAQDAQRMPCEGSLVVAEPSPSANGLMLPTLEPANPDALYEPGSAEAMDLVRAYLALLDQGQTEKAYALLAPGYQARMPLSQYALGYAPVKGITLLGLSAVRQHDGSESVRALVRIAAWQVDAPVVGDWLAEVEVVAVPDGTSNARAISDVRIKRVAIEE